MKNLHTLLFLFLLASASQAQRNVILIIADDLGTDYLGFYEDHQDTAAVPNIRSLLNGGVRFTRAMSNPVCSATRAGILTGRYSFRTGVGSTVGGTGGSGALSLTEKTIPLLLETFQPTVAKANIGKWHLHLPTPASNYNNPNTLGYDHYAGAFIGALPDYYNWTKVTNGTSGTVTTYATTETANDAIAWTTAQTEPFFLWLAFNAPHPPYHLPPAGLHSYTNLSGTQQHINQNPVLYFKASLEALDHEIGRLFDSLEVHNLLDSTDIIFIGDNGNTMQTAQIANTDKAKGTIYQYGVHVPMIISGPSVVNPGRVSNSLVNTADLYATILELFGYNKWNSQTQHSKPVDTRSLLPVLKDETTVIRPWAFTEIFKNTPDTADGKAMRNLDYKLMKFDDGHQEFYNLSTDPGELNNLLTGVLNATEQTNYVELSNEMTHLPEQHNPIITSWLRNTTGIMGQHYVEGNSTPINDPYPANVQSVKYSTNWAYISCSGIPAYIIGPYLDGNPSQGTNQNNIYKMPLNPAQNTGTQSTTTGGTIGVFINGVSLFDYRDGASYNSQTGTNQGGPGGGMGDGVWNRDAVVAERIGFDCAKGHPAMGNYHHHQNPSAFNMDLQVISNICDLYLSDGLYVIDSTVHSPLLGFAYDGFPIYGAYAYQNTDGTGDIVRMKSSYSLRNITLRTHYANGTNVPDGPPVSATFPLGMYREDYEYNPTSAATPDSLDEHNGRYCVTPEYPNGIYCYFSTVDENWNSAYPYAVGPTFYGVKNVARVTNIGESTTTYNGPLLTSVATTVHVNCFGNATGAIILFADGGNPPYTYNWGNGITTQNRTGLAAGTYTVTITDIIAQTTTRTTTIIQPDAALSASATPANVDCFGNATGSINLDVSGGTSGYSFVWNDGDTAQNRPAITAGTYSVTITDANNCTTQISETITQPPGDTTEIFMTTCDPNLAGVTTDTLSNQTGCDSIIITTTTLIPSNLVIINNVLPGGIYRSTGPLTSNTTTVANSLDVQFISDASVALEHDFTVESGAVFEAKIEACPPGASSNMQGLQPLFKAEKIWNSHSNKILIPHKATDSSAHAGTAPGNTMVDMPPFPENTPRNIHLKIVPVPNAELVIIQSQVILRNNLHIKLTNSEGQIMVEKDFNQGSTICYLDTQTLYDGTYILTVTDGSSVKTFEVIVSR